MRQNCVGRCGILALFGALQYADASLFVSRFGYAVSTGTPVSTISLGASIARSIISVFALVPTRSNCSEYQPECGVKFSVRAVCLRCSARFNSNARQLSIRSPSDLSRFEVIE